MLSDTFSQSSSFLSLSLSQVLSQSVHNDLVISCVCVRAFVCVRVRVWEGGVESKFHSQVQANFIILVPFSCEVFEVKLVSSIAEHLEKCVQLKIAHY